MDTLIIFLIFNTLVSYGLSKKDLAKTAEELNNISLNRRYSLESKGNIDNVIENIVKVFEKNLSTLNLNNLYSNLKEISIEKNYWILLEGLKGCYKPAQKLVLYNFDGSLEHEMIHVASTNIKNKDDIQSGFKIFKKSLLIGGGLNEGYTDLTARRLFDKRLRVYDGVTDIAVSIEELVGKDKMTDWYFNNDLFSLLKELSRYMEYDNAIKLIMDIDRYLFLKCSMNPLSYKFYSDSMKTIEVVKQKRI